MSATFAQRAIPSPVGPITLVATERGLAYVGNAGERPERIARWKADRLAGAREVAATPALDEAERQLHEYFVGERRVFDLPLDAPGTPFRESVWRILREIPFGATTTYAAIAARLGDPNAVRAVGSANGANPLSIVVPCHRVVGSDGALTGYAGGMRTKARLLAHERLHAGQAKLPLAAQD
jgi:methylated-DNA-[protein]-cysteine S-methyltransferase